MAQETEITLPDGNTVILSHEGELTDDAIRNAVSQMGYDMPIDKSDLALNIAGEGTRIAGAMTGAIKGSRKGPMGAAVGGLLGALLAEAPARAITPREETTGESVANVALSAIQPVSRPANLVRRIMRGAGTGAGLAGAHTVTQTAIDEKRLPTLGELAVSSGVGSVIGGGLEGLIGPRVSKAVLPEKPPSITASLDKRKPTSLEQANAEANQIATPGKTTQSQSTQATPSAPAGSATVPAPVAPKPVVGANFVMPRDLAGAKPRYSFGPNQFELEFADDLDRAVYILAQRNPSRRDSDYLRAVVDQLGITEPQARSMGVAVRNAIKESARGSSEDVISVPSIAKGLLNDLRPKKAPVTVSVDDVDGIDAATEPPVKAAGRPPISRDSEVIKRDLAEHDRLEAELAARKDYGTEEYNAVWRAFEDVRGRHGGMKPGVLAAEPQAETIAQAAVKFSDGEVRTGQTHGSIVEAIDAKDLRGSEDGFVTNTGRYVSREEAMKIAKKANQLKPEAKDKGGLFVEALEDPVLPKETAPQSLDPSIKGKAPAKASSAPKAPGTPIVPPSGLPPGSGVSDDASGKIRKPIKRVLGSEDAPDEYKALLKQNPDIKYEVHNQGQWADQADAATDGELIDLLGSAASDDARAIYLTELSNRKLAAGDQQEAQRLFVEAAKLGTPGGQVVRALGVVKSPFRYLAEAQDMAEKAGKNLTKAQEDKVIQLSSKQLEASSNLNKAAKRAKEFYDKDSLAALKKAQDEFGKAKKEFDEYVLAITPRDAADMAVKMIQGNLLTPLSITSNVAGNLIFGPLQRASMSVSSALDAMITGGSNAIGRLVGKDLPLTQRSISATNPLPSVRELKAAGQGVMTAAREIVTGPSAESYAKMEVQNGFRPLRSMMDFISGENLPVDKDGNIARWDRTKAFVEGTLGVPPEAMFRMLALGDKPFRRAAEMRALLEQARLRGIKEADLEKFINFPDEKTAKIVEQAARRAVFAEENTGITTLNRFLDSDMAKLLRVDKIPALKGFMKIAGRLTVPFRQFPVNYALTAMNFAAPPLAMSKAAWYTYKIFDTLADETLNPALRSSRALEYRRKAMINLGEAAMGAMMYTAASVLWRNGLMSESSADTSAKRSDQSERMGAARLNVSGLERYLNGDDPSYQKGDKTVEWTRLGIPAVIFHIYSDQAMREQEKAGKLGEETPDFDAINMKNLMGAAPGLGSFVFDQSFLAGTSSLLEAIKDADPESPAFKNWVQNMFRATTAIAIPSTVEAVARTQIDYNPELRGKDIAETLGNIWEFKTLQMSKDDQDLQWKRNTWGEKIARTPEGANKYVYNLLDISKMGSQKPNRHDQALYDLYNETNRDSVYPDPVGRTLTMPNGSTVELTPENFEKLQETVGHLRRQFMERFVDSPTYKRLDPFERVIALESIYENANRAGRQKFLAETNVLQDSQEANPRNKVVSRSTKGVLIKEAQESP
jgi:hypothetical protein